MISNLKKYLPKFINLATFSNPQQYVQSRIKLCKKVNDLEPIRSLLIRTGQIDHKHVISEFIDQCFNLGNPEFALSVFYASKNRTLFLQNYLVKGLCKLGLYNDVISVYKCCVNSGCRSGDYTFPYVIRASSGLRDVNLGREVHCVVLRTGYDCNVFVQTALVDFYSKIGRVDVARKVFDGMSEWDVVSCSALISGYCYNGLYYEAFDVFHDMWVSGVKANVLGLASIIPVCTRLGFRNMGRLLHGYAVKVGFDQDESLIPALISLYASNGDMKFTGKLFDLSPVHNVVIWTSFICAYTQNENPERAFEMFSRMVDAGLRPNAVTFVSVIPCCEKINSISHGGCLHGCVIKYGFEKQVSVSPALISMYAKLGDIDSAILLFNQMSSRNLLTWNTIISGYVNQGLSRKSLEAVREMEMAGFESDSISIINILSACSELQSLLLGMSAHGIIIRKGFDSNPNVSTLLLAFYSCCCKLHYSFKLFAKMPKQDCVSWNTMISNCLNHGENHKAESLLWGMQQEGLQFDIITLISVLPVYNEPSKLVQGMTLHGYAVKYGFISDVAVANAVISMYCNCNYLAAASLVFHTMMRRCVVSWNALMTGYRCHNLHEEASSLIKEMINDGQKPNYITLLNVLPGCCTLLQGKSVHSYAIRMGVIRQEALVTSLISMYSRFKNVKLCQLLFQAGNKSVISLWNVMLSAVLEAEGPEKVFALFHELLQTELEVDYVTVLSLISACGHLNSTFIGNSILCFAIKNGFPNETNICNALTDLYAKKGDLLMAKSVFDSLLYKDTISWSIMMNAYGLHGYGYPAIALLSEMRNSGTKPDRITYLNLLSACSHSGLSEEGKTIFDSMLKCGTQPEMGHYACVVDLLGRAGDIHEAYDTVKKMPFQPSVNILESLLGACRVYGNLQIGEKVGQLLIEKDPKNPTVYVSVYNLYAGVGRWEDANKVRVLMEEQELRKSAAISVV